MYQPNTDALYHGTINDATRELARLVYEVAKAHDVFCVYASVIQDGKRKTAYSYAGIKHDEFTPTMVYKPGKEESTDENSNA